MIKVYIASPYTIGDPQENVDRQRHYANILIDHGFAPFWPLSSHYLHELIERDYETWMELDIEWLLQCDCVLRLPGESSGADREVEIAIDNNIPVYEDILELFWMYEK